MVKVLSFSFEQCFGPFTMLLVKQSSETELYLTTFVGDRKFKNTSAMRVIFLVEIFKIKFKFRKSKKK